MIGREYSSVDSGVNVVQETKVVSIAHTKTATLDMVNAVHLSSNGCSVTYLLKNIVDDNINISGFSIHNDLKAYKLDKNKNFQQYLAHDTIFRSYLDLTMQTNKELFL